MSILSACAQQTDYLVTFKTRYGDMVAVLYDQTPKHKGNFVKLATEHYFDSLLFHRVIQDFMIQGGDPDSRDADSAAHLGEGGPDYQIDAEFKPTVLFHKKGALAAAREPDQINPKKASSGSQFYIVEGRTFTDEELKQMEAGMTYNTKNNMLRACLNDPKYEDVKNAVMAAQRAGDSEWLNSFFEHSDTLLVKVDPEYKPFTFSDDQKKAYETVGGAPHLDGSYTVFGQVVAGLDVIDKIAAVPTNDEDRPVDDLRMTVIVKEVPRKEIIEQYGDVYP